MEENKKVEEVKNEAEVRSEFSPETKLALFPQADRDECLRKTAESYKQQIINCELSNIMLIEALANDQKFNDEMVAKFGAKKGGKMRLIKGKFERDAITKRILDNDQTIESSYKGIFTIGTLIVSDLIKEGNIEDDKTKLGEKIDSKLGNN